MAAKNPGSYITKARIFFKRQDFKSARRIIEDGLEEYPNEPELWWRKALLDQATGNKEDAEEAMAKAEQEGLHFEVLKMRVGQLGAEQDVAGIRRMLEKYGKEMGDRREFQLLRTSMCLTVLQEPDEAVEQAKILIETQPDDAASRELLVWALAGAQQYEALIKAAAEGAERGVDSDAVHCHVLTAHMALGQNDEAIGVMEMLEERASDNAEIVLLLGMMHGRMGNQDEARRFLEKGQRIAEQGGKEDPRFAHLLKQLDGVDAEPIDPKIEAELDAELAEQGNDDSDDDGDDGDSEPELH